MPEEKSHEDGELFATDQNEELAEEASTTQDESKDELFESSGSEESEGEHAEKSEATEAKTTASEIKQKQVDAWQRKIDLGVATIGDLPKNQKWMATSLRPRQEVDMEKLADEIIERKLQSRDEEKSFNTLKERLGNVELSSKKKALVTAEYNDFRSMGLSKAKSLEKAMRIAGVELESRSGVLPPAGNYNPKVEDSNLTAEQRVKKLEEVRRKSSRLQAA